MFDQPVILKSQEFLPKRSSPQPTSVVNGLLSRRFCWLKERRINPAIRGGFWVADLHPILIPPGNAHFKALLDDLHRLRRLLRACVHIDRSDDLHPLGGGLRRLTQRVSAIVWTSGLWRFDGHNFDGPDVHQGLLRVGLRDGMGGVGSTNEDAAI